MTAVTREVVAQHVGRSWSGTEIEDGCPCPKAPCGLVVGLRVYGGDSEQHTAAKTIPQAHAAEPCPGRREADVLADAAAQADARRAAAEALPAPDPTDVSDLLRERLAAQQARRATGSWAERRGRV